jgi:hypothetical protein
MDGISYTTIIVIILAEYGIFRIQVWLIFVLCRNILKPLAVK